MYADGGKNAGMANSLGGVAISKETLANQINRVEKEFQQFRNETMQRLEQMHITLQSIIARIGE